MRNPPRVYLETLAKHFTEVPEFGTDAFSLQDLTNAASTNGLLFTTNQAAHITAFQRWFHFKEAFSPEFVSGAIKALGFRPTHVIDPFGGSGTTALTCQLLGISATTIEVNPFLADVIGAKIETPTAEQLRRAAADFQVRLLQKPVDMSRLGHLPPTFIEATGKDRWIFPRAVARRLTQYLQCIDSFRNERVKRFFRVILGGVLLDVSNVYVNGKGRRYRRSWEDNEAKAADLDRLFAVRLNTAFEDVVRFEKRPSVTTTVINADARRALAGISQEADLIVFSPPYPNSFDYTDIYNVELWTLGYLASKKENTLLRNETLCSHVQVRRDFSQPASKGPILSATIEELQKLRERLWDDSIPEMIGAYFRDLETVMLECRRLIKANGKVILVVGDSRYANVLVDVAAIIREIATCLGYSQVNTYDVRRMRASPQQGGSHQLRESIVELCP